MHVIFSNFAPPFVSDRRHHCVPHTQIAVNIFVPPINHPSTNSVSSIIRKEKNRDIDDFMTMRLSTSTSLVSLLCLTGRWSKCDGFQFCASKANSLARLSATIEEKNTIVESPVKSIVLDRISAGLPASEEYAETFGLGDTDAGLYAFFDAIRQSEIALALKGQPFVLRKQELVDAMAGRSVFEGFFTTKDLEKALDDDFLDAARGSTDNRKGWKVRDKI